jgi:hypothetical protein
MKTLARFTDYALVSYSVRKIMATNQEPITSAINPDVLKAFHLMWDIFPATVLLVMRDRTILAGNQSAIERGFRLGMKCFQLSADGVHKHCKANAALDEGLAQRTVVYSPVTQKVNNSYWLPLAGEKDLFVHVVIDITQYAKPELFQT